MAIFQIPVASNLVMPLNTAMLFMAINALMWVFSTFLLGGQAPVKDMVIIAGFNGLAVLIYFLVVKNFLVEFIGTTPPS